MRPCSKGMLLEHGALRTKAHLPDRSHMGPWAGFWPVPVGPAIGPSKELFLMDRCNTKLEVIRYSYPFLMCGPQNKLFRRYNSGPAGPSSWDYVQPYWTMLLPQVGKKIMVPFSWSSGPTKEIPEGQRIFKACFSFGPKMVLGSLFSHWIRSQGVAMWNCFFS